MKTNTTGNEKLCFTVVLTAGVRKMDDYYFFDASLSMQITTHYGFSSIFGRCIYRTNFPKSISLNVISLMIMTPLLQFIMDHVNEPLKDQPKANLANWMVNSPKEKTATMPYVSFFQSGCPRLGS